jgi:hypothetical protein
MTLKKALLAFGIGMSTFAAIGCVKTTAAGAESGTAGRASDAEAGRAATKPTQDQDVAPRTPDMKMPLPRPPMQAEPITRDAGSSQSDGGPCNGGRLIRQGSGFVCDCSDAPQAGPFCDGALSADDDAGVGELSSARALSISADSYYTCALLENHSVRCWGDNGFGTLGDGTRSDSAVPVAVKELGGVTQLDLGLLDACAVIEDGSLRCWGNNDGDRLRDGSNNNRNIPVVAQGLDDVIQVSLGESQSCVRHRDNRLECWMPVERQGLLDGNGSTDVVDVEAGYFITTAWFADGHVRSWGEHTLPPSAADETITRVSSGYGFVCALTDGGRVYCSGWNQEGQLGTGTTGTEGDGTVSGLNGVVDIAAGFEHACALLQNGTVRCWGQNERGQLGDGSNDDRPAPSAVSGLDRVAEVACGREHCCARTNEGRLYCWGNNDHGQLGDGTTTDRSAPVAVRGF